MIAIVLAIAAFWLALSVAGGLLFARVATLDERGAVEDQIDPGPQLQLAPAPPLGREHVA